MTTLEHIIQDGLHDTKGPLARFRKEAAEKQTKLGLPTRKWEAFQYLPLRKLYQATLSDTTSRQAVQADLHFHNGCFQGGTHTQVQCLSLEEGLKKYSMYLSNSLHTSLETEANPFMLLNVVHHKEGLFLYVPPGVHVDTPLTLSQNTDVAAAFSKLHILVGKGASLQLRLNHPTQSDASFTHCGIECTLEEGAHFSLLSEQKAVQPGWYFESLRIRQKARSVSRYFVASQGGLCNRYDTAVTLLEPGCETYISGVHELRNTHEAHTHLLVHHMAPHCMSDQKVKHGLFDSSKASFEGKILVEKEAQKTEAYQLNNNLLLGEKAKAYSKPNLEIFADDVKASHGSTTGQLSLDEQLYLQTRGLSKHASQTLLVRAFFEEMAERRPFV